MFFNKNLYLCAVVALFSLSVCATHDEASVTKTQETVLTSIEKEENSPSTLKKCLYIAGAAGVSTLAFGGYAHVRSRYINRSQVFSELGHMCITVLGGFMSAKSGNTSTYIPPMPVNQTDEYSEIKSFSALESLKAGLIATAIIATVIGSVIGVKAAISKIKKRKQACAQQNKDLQLALQENSTKNELAAQEE